MTSLTDSHCHLNHQDFAEDLEAVLARAFQVGVSRIICVGYDLPSSERAIAIAEEQEGVYATVGVHPHDAHVFDKNVELQLKSLASRSKVVAVGETGLDYYRNLSPHEVQQDVYRKHLRLAHELNLPVVIHSRDAWQDVISILDEEGRPPKGAVMHCIPAEPRFVEAAVDRGCYLGIAGPVTFQNAGKLRQVATVVPLERLLVETDAPYLSPHPLRGRRNEPSYLRIILSVLAQVRGLTPEELANRTTANALRAFNMR